MMTESALAVLDFFDGVKELAVFVNHKSIILEHDGWGCANHEEVGFSKSI